MKRFTKNALLTSTVIGAAVIANPAYAQDAEAEIEATAQPGDEDARGPIVITGSRIPRQDLTASSPLAVVNEEEFELTGAVNVEEVINTLPQVIPGFTGFSNNPGNGAATLDLRGLGSARTLVLVNGKRYMFFDTAQTVDLNTIPTFLIEQTEVVTGGASAVYGSDAVAGVVNFNLKQDFEGAEFGGTTRITEEGDGFRYSLHGILGMNSADGRGNVTLFANYTNRESVFQGDRDFSFFANQDGTDDAGNPILEPGGSSGVPTTIVDQLDFLVFDETGGSGRPGVFSGTPNDLYNYAPVNYLQLPQERFLVGGYGNYEITEQFIPYAEVTFANNRVAQELAPTPLFQTVQVNVNSPFFASDVQDQLADLDTNNDDIASIFVRRRLLEVGPRNSLDERNAFRVLGGVKGNLSDDWVYDAYYSFARTRNSNIQDGNISRSAVNQAILVNDDGTACQDPSGGCVPLNIFGLGTITPEAADFISILAQNSDISQVQVAAASIAGNFGDLTGAGPLGFAGGVEYREVKSEFIPDTALASGDVAGFNAGLPTAGGYDVFELYGEVRVPLLNENIVDRFELNGAARYSDYSLEGVGGVWTYAVGAELAPVEDITFRGQYQRAVRAPNVANLFGGASQGFPGAQDPCSDRYTGDGAGTDAVRALCIASGVPADNVFTRVVQPNSQIEGSFGGNPDLGEERSDTFTVGAVISPSAIDNFNVTVDYYDIVVDGFIGTFGGGLNNALRLCYTVAQDLNDPICQVFQGTRGPSGNIVAPNTPVFLQDNIAKFETSGVDLQVDYATDVLGGDVSLFFLGTWVDEYTFTPVAEFPDDANVCVGQFGATCGIQNEFKTTTRLSYRLEGLTASLRHRFLSSAEDDTGATAADVFAPETGDEHYFDVTLSYDLNDTINVTAGVNNLFNNLPTQLGDQQEQANTYPSVYDVLGRDYFASLVLRF